MQRIKVFFRSIPYRSIWGLVWPQTLMMLCTLFIGLTDVWVAGQISPAVQAAIGINTQIQAFLMVLGMALASAAMAAVSQSMGAGRQARAKSYVGLIMLMAVIMAAMLMVVGFLFATPMLGALQIPPEVWDTSRYFFMVVLLALPFQYIMGNGSMLFRATRNVILPLILGVIACVINVFGDLAFGLGAFGFPAFGAKGIAWSTFSSIAISAVLTVVFLKRAGLFLPRIIPRWRWMRAASPYLLKVAAPVVLTQFLWQTGYLTLFGILATLPDNVTALAGMTAGMRVESMLFMPASAFNITASIMVGNALGRGDKTEARRLGFINIVLGAGIMSLVAACMWPFREILAAVFSPDPGVQKQIVAYLIFNILSTPFTVGGMILTGVMTGAGATIYALVINTSCIWFVRLPTAWYLSHMIFGGAWGVFMAMLLSMIVQSLCMLWVFFKKDWTQYAMRK